VDRGTASRSSSLAEECVARPLLAFIPLLRGNEAIGEGYLLRLEAK
jgi:hypothetical protein